MNEKKLLYGALLATALAATYGVLRAREPAAGPVPISPVSLTDSSRTLAANEVPIQLTSSDGTGLRLVSLRAAAAIEDPLALTELHLTFENPEARVLEGTFRMTLPQGASLSRFAMKVGDHWQEGEVVEKQKARETYEDFLHRRQDPALMEQGAGNEFTARVFPIPSRGTKEIVIAYSEVIEGAAPYVLPLRGLPMLGALDVDVHATGARSDASFALHQTQFTPAADFVVDAPKLPRSPGLRAGDIAIARVVPFASSRPDPVSSAIFLVDTSASRALGISEEASIVQRTIAQLAPDTKIVVACFDQEVAEIYEGKAAGFGEADAKKIVDRGALGASDFEGALAWARTRANGKGFARVVIVGDGVATAGETDVQKIKASVEKLRDARVERIDAVAMGGIRDDAFLRGIVRGVLDKDGAVLDAKLGADAIARRLAEGTSSGVPVVVEGATWSWPKTLDGLQAGDEVVVYANLAQDKPFKVVIGSQELAPDLRTIDRPLVERAWARAKIQSLLEAPTSDPATTKREIVQLSTRHRVLSPHTAMLVLETEHDYQRYAIDRTATVDILTVRDGRVAVVASERERRVPPVMTGNSQTKGTAADNGRIDQKPKLEKLEESPQAAESGGKAFAVPRRDDDAEEAELPAGTTPPRQGWLERPNETVDVPGGAPAAEPPPVVLVPPRATATAGAPPPAPRPIARPAVPPPPPPVRRGAGAPPADPAPAASAATATITGRGASGSVRHGALVVERGLAQDDAQRAIRQALPQLRACYTGALATSPSLAAHVDARVTVGANGRVTNVSASSSPASPALERCVTQTIGRLELRAPGTGDAAFTTSFDFVPDQGDGTIAAEITNLPEALPYEGNFQIVMSLLARGDKDAALAEAIAWRAREPGDVLALVALGEALEAKGDIRTAARAYGSILELYSFRADSRRFAGERLERLGDPAALALAADTYAKAAEQRGDHPASHRLHAFALVKRGEHEKAFEALAKGLARRYPPGRFAGYDRILREDLGLVAAAWIKAQPARAAEIRTKLREAGGTPETSPSLRFVLVWETDANDVDFHIHDGRGGHAYYAQRSLPSGGELYADVTTGYGPECFTIRAPKEKRAYPYTLRAHYYSRGPMGYGMGKLEVVEHDGQGGLTFDERPFVVMKDGAYVDLGKVDRNKSGATASVQ